jgi:MinD superfamily P-loop ATPase
MILTTWGRSYSGKTTLAVNLAFTLANRGNIVGVLSSNLQYAHLQSFFGQTVFDGHGTFRAIEGENAQDHYWKSGINENIFVMAVPNEYNGLDYESVTQNQAEKLITQSSACFDYLIIDGSEDVGNPISSVGLTLSDTILLLHRPSLASGQWWSSKRDIIHLLQCKDRLLHLLNAYDKSCVLSEYLSNTGVKPLLEFPFVQEAPTMENMGTPLFSAKSKKAREYQDILEKLAGEVTSGE